MSRARAVHSASTHGATATAASSRERSPCSASTSARLPFPTPRAPPASSRSARRFAASTRIRATCSPSTGWERLGSFGSERYARQRSSLLFGTARGDRALLTARLAYGTVGDGEGADRERYAVGGFRSALIDPLFDARRVEAPAYPVGSASGLTFASYRVGVAGRSHRVVLRRRHHGLLPVAAAQLRRRDSDPRAGHRCARDAGGRDPRRIRARPGRARARGLAVLREPRASTVMSVARL